MRPNIIFILADDLGYGDLSRFNGGISQTPHLDAFAAEGICLGQHYAASPVCNPSRASLLTGRYPHRTGSIDTYDHLGSERLSLRERTLADTLRHAGYATGLVGKWHSGTIGEAYHPNRRGFQEFFGFRGGWQFYFDAQVERNGTPVHTGDRYLTDVFTDEAIGFVTRHREEPFFLHLAYNAPHFPLQAPEADIAPFRDCGHSDEVATLYGMVRNMDRNIGRLLAELDQHGLRDNTIICFTSDNGPDFGNGGALTRFTCDLRGQKGTTWEGGIKVPMLMRWPDGLPGNRSLDDFAHLNDWYPTLLNLCGVPTPSDQLAIDGRDLAPLLRGQHHALDPVRCCWQFNRYYPYVYSNASVRDGDWKLVFPRAPQTYREEDGRLDEAFKRDPTLFREIVPTPPRSDFSYGPPLPPQLFHLGQDPGETTDCAASDPVRVQRMVRQLEDWFANVEADRRLCPDAVFV